MNANGYRVHEASNYINVKEGGGSGLPPLMNSTQKLDFDREFMQLGSSSSTRNIQAALKRQLSQGGSVLIASGNSIVSNSSQKNDGGTFQMSVFTPDKYNKKYQYL